MSSTYWRIMEVLMSEAEMKHPSEVDEALAILSICESLRPHKKMVLLGIAKLLASQPDSSLGLCDLLTAWLQLDDSKRARLMRWLRSVDIKDDA